MNRGINGMNGGMNDGMYGMNGGMNGAMNGVMNGGMNGMSAGMNGMNGGINGGMNGGMNGINGEIGERNQMNANDASNHQLIDSEHNQPLKKNKPRKLPKLNKTVQLEEDDDPDATTKWDLTKEGDKDKNSSIAKSTDRYRFN
jgi:hypothetical protein